MVYTMPNIISTIKQQCDGRWDSIIETLTGFTGKPSYCPQHHGKSGKGRQVGYAPWSDSDEEPDDMPQQKSIAQRKASKKKRSRAR